MPTYKIRIEKITPNPEFENEKKDAMAGYGRNRNFDMPPSYPREEIVKDVLVVELNEEQFKAVKLEVLKAFE